ncbi:MAG: hypothetical protein JWO58_973 [Chitinophagaceae bacterium]|nr:hypothetical protein [Chitinophagaceae bacterium]
MIKTTLLLDQEQQLYRFEKLKESKGIVHAITTRNSLATADFNLSFHTGQEEQVIRSRKALQHFFKATSLTIPKQCHGTKVVQITEVNNHEIPLDTDALVTNVPGLTIGVLSADCVPILFYDPVKRVLGAAHAGWKGTVANIVGATLKKMQEFYGCNFLDIEAYIGPSISSIHFEVGEEVAAQFEKLELKSCIQQTSTNKPHIDLWLANKILLQRSGVKKENIDVSEMCTYDHVDHFYSARKEGFQTGRFGAFIMLR